MNTSIKLDKETKRILDTLQARITLKTGNKISQQKILDTIIKFSAEHEEQLLDRALKVRTPLPDDEIDKLLRSPTDWGVETLEEDIDQTLYAEKPSTRGAHR